MREQLLQNYTLYEIYETDNCTYWFYDVLCWMEIKEGVHFSMENYIDSLLLRVHKYYGAKAVPFITNRIKSYSFKVMDSVNFPELGIASCFVTICHRPDDYINVQFGKQFFKIPFIILETPEKAMVYLAKALKEPVTFCNSN